MASVPLQHLRLPRSRLLATFADRSPVVPVQPINPLTDREEEVLALVARGRTNAEIAAELYMSVPTVKAHITHILTKLGLGNRTQIALLAHDANLA